MQSEPIHPVATDPALKQVATQAAGEQDPDCPGDGTLNSETERFRGLRRAYAHRTLALAGVDPASHLGSRLFAAFASIPREKFVGPPPWSVVAADSSQPTHSDDPAILYQDAVVSLGGRRGLNNGQPSLHAGCLATLAPMPGEAVVHVGAGTGYYTTILAMLVGETGRVDAFEIEPDLAQRARQNLAAFPNVVVHCRSGAEGPLPACDVLYVNAGSPEPLVVWLDALRVGGRLLFPMVPSEETGAMLLATHKGENAYAARCLWSVQFVSCFGTHNPHVSQALTAAFRNRRCNHVRRLVRDDQPDASCWVAGRGWWLSTEP